MCSILHIALCKYRKCFTPYLSQADKVPKLHQCHFPINRYSARIWGGHSGWLHIKSHPWPQKVQPPEGPAVWGSGCPRTLRVIEQEFFPHGKVIASFTPGGFPAVASRTFPCRLGPWTLWCSSAREIFSPWYTQALPASLPCSGSWSIFLWSACTSKKSNQKRRKTKQEDPRLEQK